METLTIKEEELNKALDEAFKEAGVNAYFGNGFKAGVKFALKTLDATIKETVKEKNVLCSNCGCETEKMGEDYWCRMCHNEIN